MTGVLHSLMGMAGGDRYTVTVGNSGDVYGYNDGVPIGSLSPSATFRGATIRVISNDVVANTFTVSVNGVLAQNFFGGIEIQRTDGAIQIYNTPDTATFVSGPISTSWQWTMASDNWTSTGTRTVRLF